MQNTRRLLALRLSLLACASQLRPDSGQTGRRKGPYASSEGAVRLAGAAGGVRAGGRRRAWVLQQVLPGCPFCRLVGLDLGMAKSHLGSLQAFHPEYRYLTHLVCVPKFDDAL